MSRRAQRALTHVAPSAQGLPSQHEFNLLVHVLRQSVVKRLAARYHISQRHYGALFDRAFACPAISMADRHALLVRLTGHNDVQAQACAMHSSAVSAYLAACLESAFGYRCPMRLDAPDTAEPAAHACAIDTLGLVRLLRALSQAARPGSDGLPMPAPTGANDGVDPRLRLDFLVDDAASLRASPPSPRLDARSPSGAARASVTPLLEQSKAPCASAQAGAMQRFARLYLEADHKTEADAGAADDARAIFEAYPEAVVAFLDDKAAELRRLRACLTAEHQMVDLLAARSATRHRFVARIQALQAELGEALSRAQTP